MPNLNIAIWFQHADLLHFSRFNSKEIKTNIVVKSTWEGLIETYGALKHNICGQIHKCSHGDRTLSRYSAAVSEDHYGNIIFTRRSVAETTNDKQILPSNKFD